MPANTFTYTGINGIIYGGIIPGPPILSGNAIVFGDSLTALTYNSGGYRWGLPLTLYPPKIIYNAGIANETIQNLINRVQTDVIAKNPQFVILRIGTNSLGLDAPTFEAQYRQLLDLLLAAKIFVICHSVPPKTGVTGSFIVSLNNYISAQCAADPSHLYYVSDSNGLGDSNYNYNSAYYIDGIHMNGIGEYTQGLAMSTAYSSILPQVSPLITSTSDIYPANSSSNQWVQNPFMTGTGGSVYYATGTVPTGWGVSCNGVSSNGANTSIISADVGDPNQTPWLRVEFVQGVANGSTSISVGCSNPVIAADLTVERFDVLAEVRLVNFNTANVTSISLSSGTSCPGLNLAVSSMGTLTKNLVLRTSYARDEGPSGSVTPSSHPANTVSVGVTVQFGSNFSTSIGFMDVRRISVRGLST